MPAVVVMPFFYGFNKNKGEFSEKYPSTFLYCLTPTNYMSHFHMATKYKTCVYITTCLFNLHPFPLYIIEVSHF